MSPVFLPPSLIWTSYKLSLGGGVTGGEGPGVRFWRGDGISKDCKFDIEENKEAAKSQNPLGALLQIPEQGWPVPHIQKSLLKILHDH